MESFDKSDVALELLDAAVVEHLDHGRHFAAYNMAAVAQELLSKLLRCQRMESSADLKIRAFRSMSLALGQSEKDAKVWRKEFDRLKNTIKHMDSRSDRFFCANIEADARRKIGDAVNNLEKLKLPQSVEVTRFQRYFLERDR
jgi:hypothetical protein